jgi:ribosomal protein L37E
MIDKESERTVSGWLRLGDRLTGRTPVEGRCDRCGETGYLTEVDKQRLCAGCMLGGEAAAS